jgi:hypothetical protein
METLNDEDFELNGAKIVNKLEIHNLSEYLTHISYFKNKWKNEELWYRGVSQSSYKLIPGIYRETIWSYDKENAYNLFHNFIRQAKQMTNTHCNLGKWEWYQMQQHYGLPTRLLDWTEGYLIALFFAVRNAQTSTDCSVWILDPFSLNKITINKQAVLFTDELIMDKDDDIVNTYLYDKDIMPELPVAISPAHIDTRIKSQKSCFTIHGSYVDGFDQVYFKDKTNFKLAKLNISSSDIKNELNYAGISESTLFPDLEGLARELRHKYGMTSF